MASPFQVFRKNQTYWMAGLVVVAIISFIIAPALEQVISSSYSASKSNKNRIVSWRGGTITEEYAYRLQQIHGQAQLFLNRLATEVIANGGVPRVPGFQMTGPQQFDLGLNPYNDTLSVIQTKLFAERAYQLGITISDEAVEQYLVDLAANRIDRTKYGEIFKESSQGNLSHYELVNYLRDELATRMLLEVLEAGVSSQQRPLITPEQNWEIFQKFHKKANVEAFPVLVSDFLEKAKEANKPTDQELRKIYDEGKDQIPFSTSPKPGFKRRHAANVEFVSANLEDQLKAAIAKLTEEEIVKEYEKGVAAGRFRVPVTKETPPAGTGTPTTSPTTGEPPAPGSATPASPESGTSESNTPAGTEPPATPTEPAAPTEPAPGNPEPSPTTEGDKPAEIPDAPKADAPKDGGGGQTSLKSNSATRLVSFQEPAQPENTQPPATDAPQPPAETPATTPATAPATTDTPATTEQTPTTPAATAEATTPGTTTAASPETQPPAASDSSLNVGEAPTTPPATTPSTTTPAAPEMRTQALDEVREQITRSMVFETTRLKLQSSLSGIADKMQAYSDENQIYRRSIEAKDTTATKPAELDLQKLADENSLQYGKTGLVDAQSVLSLPIGKSMVQNSSFGQVVLTPSLPMFSPGNSQLFDTSGLTTFVFWKVEEKPESTPTFEDARAEVESVYFMQKARDAAKEKAEAMAKQLQTVGDSPWTAVLSDAERALIATPTPFTWMMSGQSSFGMPSITRVDKLDTVGDNFMRSVFATPDGQFAAIPNEPQAIYYVVRIVEKTPKNDELHKLFGLVPNQIDSQSLAQAELQMIRREWMPQIEKDLDIAWEIKPQDIQ